MKSKSRGIHLCVGLLTQSSYNTKKPSLSIIETLSFSDINVARWTAFVRWGDFFELLSKRRRDREARVFFGDPILASRHGYSTTSPKSKFSKFL